MTFKTSWSTCVRLKDIIACIIAWIIACTIAWIAIPVPPPDLEVPPPATTRCGPIQIFEGGSAKWRTSFVPQLV